MSIVSRDNNDSWRSYEFKRAFSSRVLMHLSKSWWENVWPNVVISLANICSKNDHSLSWPAANWASVQKQTAPEKRWPTVWSFIRLYRYDIYIYIYIFKYTYIYIYIFMSLMSYIFKYKLYIKVHTEIVRSKTIVWVKPGLYEEFEPDRILTHVKTANFRLQTPSD